MARMKEARVQCLRVADCAARMAWLPRLGVVSALAVGLFGVALPVAAQSRVQPAAAEQLAVAQQALPDDPSTLLASSSVAGSDGVSSSRVDDAEAAQQARPGEEAAPQVGDVPRHPTRAQARAERVASVHMKYIPADWRVKPLHTSDKVLLGMQDLVSPYTVGSWFVAAGYSQLVNGQPNYGSNAGAFGQRLGAAVLRDSSEGIFTDAVYASLLHEDPRFYVEGPRYSVLHRALAAAAHPLVTRTDSGHRTINGSLLLGYATAAALTNAYYPAVNRNFKDTTATFGTAVGGAALGAVINEFTVGLLHRDRP